MNSKSILLIGGSGQLGSDIQELFIPKYNLIIPTPNELNLLDYKNLQRRLDQCPQIDLVINCAAMTNTTLCEEKQSEAYAINGYSTKEIASFANARGVPIIHISTDYVFDGMKGSSYIESDPVNPLNIYGKSKELGESLLLKETQKGIIIRTSSLFGRAGASGKGGNFIETIIKRAREKGEVSVVDDQYMSPTHSLDLARVLDRAVVNTSKLSGIYHFANTGSTSWYLFAREIINLAGIEAKVIPVSASAFPSAIKRPSNSSLDNSKIAEGLSFSIPTWEEALKIYFTRRRQGE